MKFSITIPAYKSHFLNEAVRSVVSQTYPDWELIIVDDCSPEDLHSIVEPFLTDNRIQYHRNKQNFGAVNVVDNWNKCLSYCTGDYVICMGDDDRLQSCCLEEYKKLIEKYPALNVYHTRTEIIDEKGKVIALQESRPEWESAISLLWHRWADRDLQFMGDFCLRTSFLKGIGGYFKLPLAWGTDDATSFIAAQENGIANTQVFCFQYRESPYTISRSPAYAKIKIEVQTRQFHWYQKMLEELSSSHIPDDDRRYLETIDKARATYYRKAIGQNCVDYIKGNPLRLAYVYHVLKLFHFPTWLFLKWYVSSIYHSFK